MATCKPQLLSLSIAGLLAGRDRDRAPERDRAVGLTFGTKEQ